LIHWYLSFVYSSPDSCTSAPYNAETITAVKKCVVNAARIFYNTVIYIRHISKISDIFDTVKNIAIFSIPETDRETERAECGSGTRRGLGEVRLRLAGTALRRQSLSSSSLSLTAVADVLLELVRSDTVYHHIHTQHTLYSAVQQADIPHHNRHSSPYHHHHHYH